MDQNRAMLPGFRFSPTDEELVGFYLKGKLCGKRYHQGLIHEVDIYKFEPWELRDRCAASSKDPVWYFFNCQDKKHSHTARTSRTTPEGYWKATGKDRKVQSGSSIIGMKKTLVYYEGRAPAGRRTDWIMHEFRVEDDPEKKNSSAMPCTLCRLRKKGGIGPRNGEQYGPPVTFDEVDEVNESDELPSLSESRDEGNGFSSHSDRVGPGDGLPALSESRDGSEAITEKYQSDSSPAIISAQTCEDSEVDMEAFIASVFNDFNSEPEVNSGVDAMGLSPALNIDNYNEFHDFLHPDLNETEMIERVLAESMHATGQTGLTECSYYQNVFNSGNFLEYNDIKPPCVFGMEGNTPEQQFISPGDVLHAQGSAARRVRLQVPTFNADIGNRSVFDEPEVKPGASLLDNIGLQHTNTGLAAFGSGIKPIDLSSDSSNSSTVHIASSSTSFLSKHNPTYTVSICSEMPPQTYYAAVTESNEEECMVNHISAKEVKLEEFSDCEASTSSNSSCLKAKLDSSETTSNFAPEASTHKRTLKSAFKDMLNKAKSTAVGRHLSQMKGNLKAKFNERVSAYGKPASQFLHSDNYMNPYNCVRRGMMSLLYLLLAALILFCIFLGFHSLARDALVSILA